VRLGQRGLTIVEILIACAIIGVGLVALSSAIPIAAYGIQEGNQLSTATFLANQRLEQVRNAEWRAAQGVAPAVDTLGLSASATTAPVDGDGGITFADEMPLEPPYTGYTRTVRIVSCGAGAGCGGIVSADLRQITVTVTYRPMTGIGLAAPTATKSAILTMYIARR
jgi:prepilin-type N-terminal cleavage/methylation domain-containing protein